MFDGSTDDVCLCKSWKFVLKVFLYRSSEAETTTTKNVPNTGLGADVQIKYTLSNHFIRNTCTPAYTCNYQISVSSTVYKIMQIQAKGFGFCYSHTRSWSWDYSGHKLTKTSELQIRKRPGDVFPFFNCRVLMSLCPFIGVEPIQLKFWCVLSCFSAHHSFCWLCQLEPARPFSSDLSQQGVFTRSTSTHWMFYLFLIFKKIPSYYSD